MPRQGTLTHAPAGGPDGLVGRSEGRGGCSQTEHRGGRAERSGAAAGPTPGVPFAEGGWGPGPGAAQPFTAVTCEAGGGCAGEAPVGLLRLPQVEGFPGLGLVFPPGARRGLSHPAGEGACVSGHSACSCALGAKAGHPPPSSRCCCHVGGSPGEAVRRLPRPGPRLRRFHWPSWLRPTEPHPAPPGNHCHPRLPFSASSACRRPKVEEGRNCPPQAASHPRVTLALSFGDQDEPQEGLLPPATPTPTRTARNDM